MSPTSRRRWPAALTGCALLLAAAASGSEAPPNRLAAESSPYLLLHADNPVDWYPWGEEALARARREGKPIFLSVGYSTCYWCHVMERQVFSDPEIAALMNRDFVSVKVDREERPDLDEIYMTATQLLTGHGGWPNSVFLTPELEPFFAGTYFPPDDAPGRPGFPRVLASVSRSWRERRAEVEAHAARVAAAVEEVLTAEGGPGPPPVATAERAADALLERFDAEWGGFGPGPKFPSPGNLALLWDRAAAGDPAARHAVVASLAGMTRGAIHDQLGGGLHRYTLDAAWRVPHFEKMLYDNALVGELAARVAAATGDAEAERLARSALAFLLEEMALPEGAFRSAIDAETDGVEGAYYLWTDAELEAALTAEQRDLLGPIFGLELEPLFEGGRRALFLTASLEDHATRLGVALPTLRERLEGPLATLRERRRGRRRPRVDDKVLTDWNAMAVAALATGGRLLGEPRYVEAAARAAGFLLGVKGETGGLLHVWRDGVARVPAFLDDYAHLIRALLALHETTGEERWLGEAERLAAEADGRLGLPGGGYSTAGADPELLLRAATATDGAIPSGNGVLALSLLELARRTGETAYRRRAARALGAFHSILREQPAAAATVARAVARYHLSGAPEGDAAPPVVSVRGRSRGAAAEDPWRRFEVTVEIAPGWHLNANPASADFLVPTRLEGPARAVVYPAGEPFAASFTEQPLSVYSGTVALSGEIRPDGSLTLLYQACDHRRCLPPARLAVPLAEEDGGS